MAKIGHFSNSQAKLYHHAHKIGKFSVFFVNSCKIFVWCTRTTFMVLLMTFCCFLDMFFIYLNRLSAHPLGQYEISITPSQLHNAPNDHSSNY